ncbi:helix-turn-helix domain-containing protein [Ornithinibacillus xuwenensis]|jgi:transcriptional regulator with XRE-family HTH domain|uniref:Helix-turn-helix transcriptional regulator n=1 Tax=Ornithinibacillus xuwenensis TaxID=3144668 RepID=A0ABU9XG61_9BACI
MERSRIGRRIKAYRKLKGYTQVDFAKVIGVSLNELGSIERGTREISEELLEKIAETLIIDKEEILG